MLTSGADNVSHDGGTVVTSWWYAAAAAAAAAAASESTGMLRGRAQLLGVCRLVWLWSVMVDVRVEVRPCGVS